MIKPVLLELQRCLLKHGEHHRLLPCFVFHYLAGCYCSDMKIKTLQKYNIDQKRRINYKGAKSLFTYKPRHPSEPTAAAHGETVAAANYSIVTLLAAALLVIIEVPTDVLKLHLRAYPMI